MCLFVILYFIMPVIILIYLIGAATGTIPMSGSWNETMLVIGVIWLVWTIIKFFRNR